MRENAVRVGGKILIGTPKSHEARTVPFPPFLSERWAALCADKTPDLILFGNGLSHQRTPSTRDVSLVYALDVYADLFADDLDSVAVALDRARMISSMGKMWANRAPEALVAELKPRSA